MGKWQVSWSKKVAIILMSKPKYPEYHIPRTLSPEAVLSAFAHSMTLRDFLNSMEATAELLLMVDYFKPEQQDKFLEESSERLKWQISEIRAMLNEVKDYLKERELADNHTASND